MDAELEERPDETEDRQQSHLVPLLTTDGGEDRQSLFL